ncbi:MAG TPA: right-handed parallel beta-helix repeat-containing protein, partial [Candidatus Sumerlaeota bacterium]|nr:right-handed parallel beta-helix repeat-containing protein [Candidatus Sumerlaeota bacterium]
PSAVTGYTQSIEIAIPKAMIDMNVFSPIKAGDRLYLTAYMRPDQNKPGITATAPCDPAALSDWGDGISSPLSAQKCYTWAAGKSPAQEAWVDSTALIAEDTDGDDQFATIQGAITALAPSGTFNDGNDFNDIVRLYCNAPHVPAAQLLIPHSTWIAGDPTTTSQAVIRSFNLNDTSGNIILTSNDPDYEVKFKDVILAPQPQVDHTAGYAISNTASATSITLSLENSLICASNDDGTPASDMTGLVKRVPASMSGYDSTIWWAANLTGGFITTNVTSSTLTQARYYGIYTATATTRHDINIASGSKITNIGARGLYLNTNAAGSTLDIIGGLTPAERVQFRENQTEQVNFHGVDIRLNNNNWNATIKHVDSRNSYGSTGNNEPAIYLYGGTHVIEDVHCWNHPARGVRLRNGCNVAMKDCVLENCGTNNLYIGDGNATFMADNCTFKNAGWIGVNLAGSAAVLPISFKDCLFTDNNEAGLYVYNNNAYLKDVDDCLFFNNALNAASADKSNYFTGSDVATGPATFRRCTFHNPSGTVPNALIGKALDTAAQIHNFVDCVFSGAGDTGIDMTGKGDNNVTIDHCTFASSGTNALAAIVTGGTPTYIPAAGYMGYDPFYKSTDPVSPDFLTVTNPYLEFANSTGGALSGWGAYEKEPTVPVELSIWNLE